MLKIWLKLGCWFRNRHEHGKKFAQKAEVKIETEIVKGGGGAFWGVWGKGGDKKFLPTSS